MLSRAKDLLSEARRNFRVFRQRRNFRLFTPSHTYMWIILFPMKLWLSMQKSTFAYRHKLSTIASNFRLLPLKSNFLIEKSNPFWNHSQTFQSFDHQSTISTIHNKNFDLHTKNTFASQILVKDENIEPKVSLYKKTCFPKMQ